MVSATPALAFENVRKSYGARVVLDRVDLVLHAGRVHALVGENGAGKSTLVGIAAGTVQPDGGTVRANGSVVVAGDPRASSASGIGVVHQHFMLVEPFTVAENVALGRESRSGLAFDREHARSEVRAMGERYGFAVDPDTVVETLAVGERQRVELLKVLVRNPRVVLLDEPTAVLSPTEIPALLDVIRGLARDGAAVLFVSHKLDEVLAVADDVTVLRRGRVSLRAPREGLTADAIARAVIGSENVPGAHTNTLEIPAQNVTLALEHVSADGLHDVSLDVSRGEVLGIAGVEGNGQRALAEVIAGLRTVHAGRVVMAGADVTHASVGERRARGLGFVPEDREGAGLMPSMSVADNLALGDPSLRHRARSALERDARGAIARYAIVPDDPWTPMHSLSGGNAQKVLVARELSRTLTVLVVSQPTRGIDLGAARAVHDALRAAREAGVAVVLVSSDLDELRALADTVAVMRAGRLVATFPANQATDARLGPLFVGGTA